MKVLCPKGVPVDHELARLGGEQRGVVGPGHGEPEHAVHGAGVVPVGGPKVGPEQVAGRSEAGVRKEVRGVCQGHVVGVEHQNLRYQFFIGLEGVVQRTAAVYWAGVVIA